MPFLHHFHHYFHSVNLRHIFFALFYMLNMFSQATISFHNTDFSNVQNLPFLSFAKFMRLYGKYDHLHGRLLAIHAEADERHQRSR